MGVGKMEPEKMGLENWRIGGSDAGKCGNERKERWRFPTLNCWQIETVLLFS